MRSNRFRFRFGVHFAVLTATSPFVVGASSGPLVIDHTSVELYARIPQGYLDEIKKMWVTIPGESHSTAYRKGAVLLEAMDERFRVSATSARPPETYTEEHLRLSGVTWGDVANPSTWRSGYGEEDWYTSDLAVQRTQDGISYCNTNGYEIAAMGFGWCWDMTWQNAAGGGIHPVYQVRWAGSSVGGPDGNLRWGLSAEDYALTGNRVCMDTYLAATQAFDDYSKANGYKTRVFFTTGPVDSSSGERAYQRQIKHDHIRDYVRGSVDGILFDYADILSWSDSGNEHRMTWTDYGGQAKTYQTIHPDNMMDLNGSYDEDGDHIGEVGAVRLAKALWVMLAKMAGWDSELGDPNQTPKLRVSILPEGDQILCEWDSTPTARYRIEYCGNLCAEWAVACEDVLGTGDVIAIVLPIDSEYQHCSYRLVMSP